MNTIELTNEQFASLQAGESITISPPPKEPVQWEPHKGSFCLNMDGSVEIRSVRIGERLAGVCRTSKRRAYRDNVEVRTHNRLLAYCAEFDSEFEADWEDTHQLKFYVQFKRSLTGSCPSKGKWSCGYNQIYKSIGTVYMSRKCASDLIDKLNSGEVSL